MMLYLWFKICKFVIVILNEVSLNHIVFKRLVQNCHQHTEDNIGDPYIVVPEHNLYMIKNPLNGYVIP